MPSLTWRIAAWYAALLILVLAVTSGLIAWRFQQILSDEAHARIDSTMRDIVQTVQPASGPLAIDDRSAQSWELLLNTNNLADWESPTSFVQVDNAQGYPLAKTSNLGGRTIPKNPSLSAEHPRDFRQVDLHGEPFLVEDRYLQLGDSAAIIYVAEPLDALNRAFAQTRSATLAIILVAMLAVTLRPYLLASQATRPINQLSHEMREIGSDRLDRRLAWPHRNDEIGQLAESFDDLLARLEEAFARERQFISDASHELKTPLTSINANAQMLLRWGDRDERTRVESLNTIVGESASLAGMVNGMLTLAKADRGDAIPKTPVSLRAVAADVVASAAQRAREENLSLEVLDGDGTIMGDPQLLRQLVANLVDNALKFTERGGVFVRAGTSGETAWIEVADTGPGIPEDELPLVFDRFYRADKSRSREVAGTGLGLAIVRSIARVHGGHVEAMRRPGGGTLFRATFPALQRPLTDSS